MNIRDLKWEPHPDAHAIRKAAIIAIQKILSWDDIFDFQKSRLINYVLLWDLTEAAEQNYTGVRGKYKQVEKKYNLRYWSNSACDNYDVNGGSKRSQILRHEHVISRKRLLRYIQDGAPPLNEKIDALTKPENVPACVVTIEENKQLNKVKDRSGWERYSKLEIKVYDRLTGSFADLSELHKEIDPKLLE